MYLFERKKERVCVGAGGGGAEREGDADSRLSREHDVGLGLHPGTQGSRPEMKADI